tara:strand:- start:346 stop:504 length:159 start_codon:yes stop_codon:yes gene_type:complete
MTLLFIHKKLLQLVFILMGKTTTGATTVRKDSKNEIKLKIYLDNKNKNKRPI